MESKDSSGKIRLSLIWLLIDSSKHFICSDSSKFKQLLNSGGLSTTNKGKTSLISSDWEKDKNGIQNNKNFFNTLS